MRAPLRVTDDDASQQHGSVPHPEWWGGMRTTLAIQLWENESKIACGRVARAANDLLMRHVLPLAQGGGRLVWTPTDAADRMVDQLWLQPELAESQPDAADPLVAYTVSLLSPFPYAMTAAEILTHVYDGSSGGETLDNLGTMPFYPVMKAYGPTSGFTIRNESTGLELVYDATLPGASAIGALHYVELDFFRNSAYLDGSGASRKAGIDVLLSDFFTLDPGPNLISVAGADVDVLWQPAWG